MAKPQLPLVPDILRERIYKPSGRCTLASIALMLGLGVPVALIIGAAGHYIGRVIPPLLAFMGEGLVDVGRLLWRIPMGKLVFLLLVVITVVAALVVLGLGYPAVVGAAIGGVTWLLARRGKCRSLSWAAGIGLINAIVGYGILNYITERSFGGVRLSSQILYSQIGPTPWWLYPLICIDALIFLGVAAAVAYYGVIETPFCERCGRWYGNWRKGNLSLNMAEPLLQTLESGSMQALREASLARSFVTEHPYLEVELRRCVSCEISDFQIAVSVAWKEVTTDKEGKEISTEYKSEEWFKAMVPSDLSTQLDELLL